MVATATAPAVGGIMTNLAQASQLPADETAKPTGPVKPTPQPGKAYRLSQ
jgi:hypothetical protein